MQLTVGLPQQSSGRLASRRPAGRPSPGTGVLPHMDCPNPGWGERLSWGSHGLGRTLFCPTHEPGIPLGRARRAFVDCQEQRVCAGPGVGANPAWQGPAVSASPYCLSGRIIRPLIAISMADTLAGSCQKRGCASHVQGTKARGSIGAAAMVRIALLLETANSINIMQVPAWQRLGQNGLGMSGGGSRHTEEARPTIDDKSYYH